MSQTLDTRPNADHDAATEIESVPELLAHALRIEEDAEERYLALAEQMETHHNTETARLFRWFASHEAEHAREIRERMACMPLPDIKPWDFKWEGAESPEAVDFGAVRYTISVREALELALGAEERALAFFGRIAELARDPEMRRWAAEFAEEEAEHVRLVKAELAKLGDGPPPPPEDPDPPNEPL
jgi:rubrerythrin